MERLRCPICDQTGLLSSPAGKRVRKNRVICENDHFVHFQIGEFHFLARSERNVLEELNLERESVVLN